MRKQEIETMLRGYFDRMLRAYSWLRIRFEYSREREVFLVSYYTVDGSEDTLSDSFVEEAMRFEDKTNLLFGDDAPLFCIGEKYFRLSDKAETVAVGACLSHPNKPRKDCTLIAEGCSPRYGATPPHNAKLATRSPEGAAL